MGGLFCRESGGALKWVMEQCEPGLYPIGPRTLGTWDGFWMPVSGAAILTVEQEAGAPRRFLVCFSDQEVIHPWRRVWRQISNECTENQATKRGPHSLQEAHALYWKGGRQREGCTRAPEPPEEKDSTWAGWKEQRGGEEDSHVS